MDRHGHTPKGCPVVRRVLISMLLWQLSVEMSKVTYQVQGEVLNGTHNRSGPTERHRSAKSG